MAVSTVQLSAQDIDELSDNGQNQEDVSSGDNNDIECTDYTFSINSDVDIYGLSIGGDIGKGGYLNFSAAMGFGDIGCYSFSIGYGGKYRDTTGPIMLLGAVIPYIGLAGVEIEDKWKSEFSYGIGAFAKLGIRIIGKNYVTVGYHIDAPKFKTKNMMKNGSWLFGITHPL